MSDDNKKIAQQVLIHMPKIRKDVDDVVRLIELAKKSPFAGANMDFLERMEMVWVGRKGERDTISEIVKQMSEGK